MDEINEAELISAGHGGMVIDGAADSLRRAVQAAAAPPSSPAGHAVH
jgi:hypothetical protein